MQSYLGWGYINTRKFVRLNGKYRSMQRSVKESYSIALSPQQSVICTLPIYLLLKYFFDKISILRELKSKQLRFIVVPKTSPVQRNVHNAQYNGRIKLKPNWIEYRDVPIPIISSTQQFEFMHISSIPKGPLEQISKAVKSLAIDSSHCILFVYEYYVELSNSYNAAISPFL